MNDVHNFNPANPANPALTEPALTPFDKKTNGGPDRAVALQSYRERAAGYDRSSANILAIRAMAIHLLGVRPGDVVFDVACGTGPTLLPLAAMAGPEGRVIGIEQSPEMAAIARARLAGAGEGTESDAGTAAGNAPMAGAAAIDIIEAPVEDAVLPARADRMLFCYTHDVLQNPHALANLFAAAKPGARVVVVGIRLVSWWLAPLNLLTCWRTRHYLSTFRGLSEPWAPLRAYCPDLTVVRTYHAGTSYLATGRTPLAARTARTPRESCQT